MKKLYRIEGADFKAELPHDCGNVLTLQFDNGFKCEVAPAACGAFSEGTALTRKVRVHRTNDLLEASANSLRVIPFGCEFEIKRKLDFADGFVQIIVDAAAGNGGRIDEFTLDPLVFRGSWKRFGLDDGREVRWIDAVDEEAELWSSDRPLLRILAESTGGALFECGCGEDIWRHNVAQTLTDCTAQFTVKGSRTTLCVERKMFQFAKEPEVVIPRRPWRFSYYIAWSLTAPKADELESAELLPLDALDIPSSGMCTAENGEESADVCFAAPAVRRRLRDAVRTATGSLVIPDVKLALCYAPSHLERPGKGALEHWGLAELFTFYVWANRQLVKKEAALTLRSAEYSAAAAILCRKPRTFKPEG